jgi:hypothetical protein
MRARSLVPVREERRLQVPKPRERLLRALYQVLELLPDRMS